MVHVAVCYAVASWRAGHRLHAKVRDDRIDVRRQSAVR